MRDKIIQELIEDTIPTEAEIISDFPLTAQAPQPLARAQEIKAIPQPGYRKAGRPETKPRPKVLAVESLTDLTCSKPETETTSTPKPDYDKIILHKSATFVLRRRQVGPTEAELRTAKAKAYSDLVNFIRSKV